MFGERLQKGESLAQPGGSVAILPRAAAEERANLKISCKETNFDNINKTGEPDQSRQQIILYFI